jgi:PKD repeat protein
MKRTWAAFAALIATGMLIAGCTTTAANKNPTAVITIDKYVLFVGGTANFNASQSKDPDGKVKEFNWNYGDGSDLQNTKDKAVSHTFTTAGAFKITLWVKDDKGGKSKTVNDTVVVAPLPTSSASITDTFSNITFSVDNSSLGGLITDYSWNFGDSSPVVKGSSVVHQYSDNGTYHAILTITYKGQSLPGSVDVTIQNRAPRANITPVSLPPYLSNKAISFNGAASGDDDGTIVLYAWDFGDLGTANGSALKTVDHSFAMPGNYTVKLTVTDNDNATGTAQLSITIVKDLIITNVSIQNYSDDNSIDRANVTVKFDNKGDAKTTGTINVTVTAFKSDKTAITTGDFKLSKTNGGLVDSNSVDNTMTVMAILIDNANPGETWYWVELSYNGKVIDSGWFQK